MVQAEEAAQKEARRLAEEEELREHRRNLQFKVHILSTMLFAAQKLCSTKSIVLPPCAWLPLIKTNFLHDLCGIGVALFVYDDGRRLRHCKLYSAECMCRFAGKATANLWGALPAFPVRLQADRGQEPCLLHSLTRPLSTGAVGFIATGVRDG